MSSSQRSDSTCVCEVFPEVRIFGELGNAGAAYEVPSIDIADVDVGDANAEERRAMAVALEQETRARVVEAARAEGGPGTEAT